ncbi:MAG: IPT/TIG domain-containing protein [Candidatus Roizmanbacteria bacterium]
MTNAIALTSTSSAALSCSFAGGCLLSINVNGLASSMANGLAAVTVCGQSCVYSASSSTASTAKCAVPALSTVYSNA